MLAPKTQCKYPIEGNALHHSCDLTAATPIIVMFYYCSVNLWIKKYFLMVAAAVQREAGLPD